MWTPENWEQCANIRSIALTQREEYVLFSSCCCTGYNFEAVFMFLKLQGYGSQHSFKLIYTLYFEEVSIRNRQIPDYGPFVQYGCTVRATPHPVPASNEAK